MIKKGHFLCVKNMFRRCVCFLVFITCFKASVGWAASSTVTQNFNFGTFIQISANSSFTLDYNGNYNSLIGLSTSSTPSFAIVHYESESHTWGQFDQLEIQDAPDIQISASGCIISISNVTRSSDGAWLGRVDQTTFPTTLDVNFGASVSISGFCKEGTYSGIIDVPYTSSFGHTSGTTSIPFTISFQDIIGITNKQDINFGSMISPSSDVVVNVSYSGQRSASGNIYLLNDVPPSNGIFTITGQVGRTIYLGLPSDVLIYNEQGNTLTVNNFVSSTGDSFVLDVDTVDAAIGASLNVPRDSSPGNYSGTYTVTVSY